MDRIDLKSAPKEDSDQETTCTPIEGDWRSIVVLEAANRLIFILIYCLCILSN